jgi:hypothetical protein
MGETIFCKFFVNDKEYIIIMASFTALAKIYSTKYFYNAQVAGSGEIFLLYSIAKLMYGFCYTIRAHLLSKPLHWESKIL